MLSPLLTQSIPSAKLLGFERYMSDMHSDCHPGYATLNTYQINRKYIVLLPEEKTDEELMESYRDGDLLAFDLLYNRFKDLLYRYLARQSGNLTLAEEIFQETWLALIKHRKSYKVKSKFKTYLFHIAHNKIIDYYRSQQRTKAELISYDQDYESLPLETEPDTGLEHQADISKKHEYLLSLLDKLTAAQRDVFLMHEETGMTLNEIAEVMDVSRDTVKSRLRYALQKLRQGMGRYT